MTMAAANPSEPVCAPCPEEITEWDQRTYAQLVSTELTAEQRERITHPNHVYPRQDAVLAVHWHPECIPLDLVQRRIDAMFPNRCDELIIPTQHNVLIGYGDFCGVEVDCYSAGFNRKVQLLVHVESRRVQDAGVFRTMLAHTFKYRAHQLVEFMDTILQPSLEDRLQEAAAHAGADARLVAFVRAWTGKLRRLMDRNEAITPPDAYKNKLLMYWFDELRAFHDDLLINHALVLLKAVKAVVKANFSLEYFYGTSEVIEEVRGLGGCIVVPHPEQFWPILLAGYDVDGYEVWNPQSREYTEFLIHVVNRQNRERSRKDRPILILMGDDTHLGEKIRPPELQDPDKAGRQIGVQPAWDDLAIRKSLIVANTDRRRVIEDYRARLRG